MLMHGGLGLAESGKDEGKGDEDVTLFALSCSLPERDGEKVLGEIGEFQVLAINQEGSK